MPENIRIFAEGFRAPEGPLPLADGSVVVCEMFAGKLSRAMPDGKVVTVAHLGGSPNGVALGPDGAAYVCNSGGMHFEERDGKLFWAGKPPGHKGGWIQRVDLATGAFGTIYDSCNGNGLRSPNDIVFDHGGGFWFTDIGVGSARSRDHGGVYWAKADGSEIREAIYPVVTPNGIGLSPDGKTLYVASTLTRQLYAYEVVGQGAVATDGGKPRRRVVASLGGELEFDSLAVEADGTIVIGTLTKGCLTVVRPDGTLLPDVFMPDKAVTNVAFGGPDMRTAFVTLTNSGRLAAVPWPRPGLRLANQ